MMKLYFAPGACSLSAHIVLEESGMPFEAVKADIRAKDPIADDGVEYKTINPLGYVPALALNDGTVLTEVGAILQYIADQVPEKKLASANGTLDRYREQAWLSFASSELHKSFSPLFNSAMPEAAKTIARERLASRLAYVDSRLAEHDYLMGKAFSVPDAYCFVAMRWTVPTGIDLGRYPHIEAFMTRMRGRPSVGAALTREASSLRETDRGRWYFDFRD